jgi:MoxR-like ATPase
MYEWNYQKQLLAIKIQEGGDRTIEDKEAHIFSAAFLLERPLLQSITAQDAPPVLLIDEIDRADEAFEAFLLELLSDFQITIPEMGTIKAKHPPYVILTSNRTRELGDALKRRCLYHWISYPTVEKELRIVHSHMPEISGELAGQVVRFVKQSGRCGWQNGLVSSRPWTARQHWRRWAETGLMPRQSKRRLVVF